MTVLVPLLWGFSEATFFFIVPDVWLTWLALFARDAKVVRTSWRWAITGAMVGGLVSYAAGRVLPAEQLISWLDHVPGISRILVEEVAGQVSQGGAGTIFVGIIRGIPYKIYAVQWGAQAGSLLVWLVVSLVARGGRFWFSIVVTRLIDRAGERFLSGWGRKKAWVFIVFWVVFYVFYFLYYHG